MILMNVLCTDLYNKYFLSHPYHIVVAILSQAAEVTVLNFSVK
jgi:hypothetical protein